MRDTIHRMSDCGMVSRVISFTVGFCIFSGD
jgi:hypothetical protein